MGSTNFSSTPRNPKDRADGSAFSRLEEVVLKVVLKGARAGGGYRGVREGFMEARGVLMGGGLWED